MTRLMLIAGVAALAIAAPAAAGPHGGHGGGGPPAGHGGGGPHGGGGGHEFGAPQGRGGGRRGGFAMPRQQRAPMQRMNFAPRERARPMPTPRMEFAQRGRGHMDMQHGQMHFSGGDRRQAYQFQRQIRQRQVMQRQQMQFRRNDQRQAMEFRRNQQRQTLQFRGKEQRRAVAMQLRRNDQRQARLFREQQIRSNGFRQQARNTLLQQRAIQGDRFAHVPDQGHLQRQFVDQRATDRRAYAYNVYANRYAYGRDDRMIDGCPPGLAAKYNGCLPPGQAMKLVGTPLSQAARYASFSEVPRSLQYLYADTPDHYYRYGDGYLYQVNRRDNLISSLLPLVAGGYLPGMAFPTQYMNSYVPADYGYDSFYPDSEDTAYRYLDGNIYGVDPYTGAIEDVIPTYADGYGVGQMLPASYGTYNVPAQYRGMYYDTADANYWYAPGAIYQVDPRSRLITSVASLLAPGLSVGQPLPAGYDMYNVPLAYRQTYYDTPNAWYRYNNGYIYQVDPTTQLVRAIVASLLT